MCRWPVMHDGRIGGYPAGRHELDRRIPGGPYRHREGAAGGDPTPARFGPAAGGAG